MSYGNCPISQEPCIGGENCTGPEDVYKIPKFSGYSTPFLGALAAYRWLCEKIGGDETVAGYCPSRDERIFYESDM